MTGKPKQHPRQYITDVLGIVLVALCSGFAAIGLWASVAFFWACYTIPVEFGEGHVLVMIVAAGFACPATFFSLIYGALAFDRIRPWNN